MKSEFLIQKYEVREFIQSISIPYTFIDIGWWMQYAAPQPIQSNSAFKQLLYESHGNGDKKFLLTDLDHVGPFVARIVVDERTINKYVIIWEDELTQQQAKSIAEKYSGEEEALKAARIQVR